MNSDYGILKLYRHEDDHVDVIEWEGNPITEISPIFLLKDFNLGKEIRSGDVFYLGAFKVRCIDRSIVSGNYVIEWINSPIDVRIRLYLLRIVRTLEKINLRLKKTAYVWNLLDTPMGCEWQWKDLKILRKFHHE